jgi:ethanolamine utilization protein EutM
MRATFFVFATVFQQFRFRLEAGFGILLSMPKEALGLIETKGLTAAIIAADAASKAASVVLTSVEITDDSFVMIKFQGDLGAVQAAVDAGARAAQRGGELIAAHVIPSPSDEVTPLLPNRRYVSEYHPDDTRTALASEVRAPDITRAPARSITTTKVTHAVRPMPSAARPHAAAPKPRTTPPKPAETRLPHAKPAPPPAASQPAGGGDLSPAEIVEMPVVKLRRYARNFENLPIKGRQISMANKEQLLEALREIGKIG